MLWGESQQSGQDCGVWSHTEIGLSQAWELGKHLFPSRPLNQHFCLTYLYVALL